MTTHAQLLAAGRAPASAIDVEIVAVATAVPEHVTGSKRSPSARTSSIRSTPASTRSTPIPASSGATRSSQRIGTCSRTPGRSAPNPTSATRSPCWSGSRRKRWPRPGFSLRDIDAHRHQHDHRPRHPEPRGPAHEPPRLPSRRGAAADLRARLRRRRRWPRARGAHGAGEAGRATCCSSPSTCASLCLRINDPSLAMFVVGGAVRRWRGGRRPAQPWRRAPRRSPSRPRPHQRDGRLLLVEHRAHHGLGHQGRRFWRRAEPRAANLDARAPGRGGVSVPRARGAGAAKTSTASCCIPAAARCSTTAEAALGLSRDRLRYSWDVLKNYGNMSSATAMFVLKEALADGARGRFLLAAFGPGFSGYFVVLEL